MMIEDILDNDDYSKKIEELQRILAQEKANEDNVDEKESKEFINERNKLIENHKKEKQNLEKEISKLEEENKNNKYIIDISTNEINNGLLELLKNKITENIYNKINEYMKEYEKNVKIKINENANAKLLHIIKGTNDQINTNTKDINDALNDSIIKQKNIMDNIEKIKKELKIEIENKKANAEDNNNENKIEQKRSNKNLNVIANNNNQKNEFNNNKERIQKKNVEGKKKNDGYNNNNVNNNDNNKEPLDNQNNRNLGKYINSRNNDNNKGDIEYINTEKEDEDVNENKNIKIMKNNNKEKHNFYNIDNWHNNSNINVTGLLGANKNYEAKKLINVNRATEILKNLEEEKKNKKKIEYNIFNIMNNIFFINNEQKMFKFEKIKEQYKEQLYRLYCKDLNENSKQTSTYCLLFIKNNVLPIFKKNRNYNDYYLEIIKGNISTVLKILGINENYFIQYYNPQTVVEKKYDRNKSIEARINFRNKFNIGKDVIIDTELERRLEDNDLNIDQTFQAMYG